MSMMYLRFFAVLAVSLVVMFLLSLSLIRTFDHFHLSPSNFYMASIMVSAMATVMLLGMWAMFPRRQWNLALLALLPALFLTVFLMGRQQLFVGNEGFLRSMIPHHSRAILMCQEADITDAEIEELCEAIVETQREEIRQMEAILDDRY